MARKSAKTPPKEALALSEHELEERGQTTLIDTAANAAEPPQTKTKAKTRAKTRTTPKKAAEKPQDASEPKVTSEPSEKQKNESAHAAVSADPLHGTATTEAETEKTKIGQPPKYDEPTRHIGYKLPLSSIEKFKLLSELNGLSGTQYLLQVIEQEYQKNKDLIDKILELKSKAR